MYDTDTCQNSEDLFSFLSVSICFPNDLSSISIEYEGFDLSDCERAGDKYF